MAPARADRSPPKVGRLRRATRSSTGCGRAASWCWATRTRAAFLTLAAALREELAPAGPLQEHLAGQIALAIWRARRSERIETELFNFYLEKDRPHGQLVPDFGLLVIRDRNGARALDTLLRYRGSVQTELFRALAALKALQAEAATTAPQPQLLPPAAATKRTQEPL